MGKDAMNRVSTNGLFVAFFFQIGITPNSCREAINRVYYLTNCGIISAAVNIP
ncbi:hypothetical protein GXM_05629 [Nostoc sphaeroides CCNUC1]|uniref:Uncharacterized protein n=1 Tax=Nostoc sphaeroides CCNUC1 TaxID=2653204 RepID=A0A5P8W5W7_9NOSO|nr:hypothetical protein GXM_05629 [Nostoc sphaeroides CCNUC1]